MKKMNLKVQVHDHFKGELPQYQSFGASGFDVRAQLSETVEVKPLERVLIPTGMSFEVPLGYEIQVRPRSGWALKEGLTVLNTPGTIDADYRGEVKVILINLGSQAIQIKDQDRIAQFVLAPIFQADFEIVKQLSTTDRGAGGFGSTGTSHDPRC